MTNEDQMDILDGVSNGVPIPTTIRYYRTPRNDQHAAVFRVDVDKNGDVLIDQHALDILLTSAGFYEVDNAN